MDKTWNKTPKHILRYHALKDLVKDFLPGSFIEFGAGTGDFSKYFLEKQFNGYLYDIDPRTLKNLKENLQKYPNAIVINSLQFAQEQKFKYIFAFEVLEHIEDDEKELLHWSNFLEDNGTILISVPAHQYKYSKEDERVGHFRRYEKDELIALLKRTGYTNITLINYGFPLGNITRRIKNLINFFKLNKEPKDYLENSIKSGIERDLIERKVKFLFNEKLLFPFILLQKLFYKFNFGDGYILYAKKGKFKSVKS